MFISSSCRPRLFRKDYLRIFHIKELFAWSVTSRTLAPFPLLTHGLCVLKINLMRRDPRFASGKSLLRLEASPAAGLSEENVWLDVGSACYQKQCLEIKAHFMLHVRWRINSFPPRIYHSHFISFRTHFGWPTHVARRTDEANLFLPTRQFQSGLFPENHLVSAPSANSACHFRW